MDDPMQDRKLKIAFVVDRYDPGKGGGEAYVAGLARRLADLGHDVHVFARSGRPAENGVAVHEVPFWRLGKSLALISFAFSAANRVRGGGFDVSHGTGKCLDVTVFNPHGGVELAWLDQNYRSCPSPLYRAWVRLKRWLSPRHHFTLWQQRRVLAPDGARCVVAISDMIKRDLVARHGVAEDRIAVVYNGVDLDRFHPDRRAAQRREERERLGARTEEVVLLTVSHNFRLKGLAPLVEALAELEPMAAGRPYRLLVAGRGRSGPYQRLARRAGVDHRLAFVGVRPDIEGLYAAADVCVHPTYYDACSLVVFEAMAAGLPVVTTRSNGAAWALAGGEGPVLDSPDDPAALARAIHGLFDDDARAAAGRAARATAEGFPLDDNAERVLDVYRRVLSEVPCP